MSKTIDFETFYHSSRRNKVMLKRGINKEYEKRLEQKAYLKALEQDK